MARMRALVARGRRFPALAALFLTVAARLHGEALAAQPTGPHAMETTGAAPASTPAATVALLPGLGDYHRRVTTAVPRAQVYFDQGLRLLFAFNMEEAQRAFEEAARLDPRCAMCHWGVGMSFAPHINFPATPERTVAGRQQSLLTGSYYNYEG